MATHLKVGDKAPLFEEKDQQGNLIKLSDFKGQKVALYFYPKDNTPGCTAQACNVRDNMQILNSKDVKIIGVSADSIESHQKFESKYQLPFTLLADTEKNMATAYGVWGKKKFMGKEYEGVMRTTFLINEEGLIEHIIEKIDTENSVQQILQTWSL